MFRKPSFVVRATSTAATFALLLTGISVVAAAPAAADPVATVVYDSLPPVAAPSYPSIGFEANSIREFGDYIQVTPGGGTLTTATVGFTSWACETSSWNAGDCATTDGATFTHPITLNIYDVDKSGVNPAVGALLGAVTEQQTFPYRPSADPLCTGPDAGKWHDSVTNSCRNGMATNVTFDLSAANITTDDDVIVSIAYNTTDYGTAPIGTNGPWDSLNVSLAPAAPSVGVDDTEDEAFISDNTHGNVLSLDTGYTGYHGLILSLSAIPLPTPAVTEVTVPQVDVKPTENASTYLQWHEGKNNATPAYSVKPDGLHLGDGAASTIIKGIAGQEVTKAQLRALIIAGASANVVSVSDASRLPTFQVPLSFGTAQTPGNYTFTTLHTSMNVGNNTFALGQGWRTSRAFAAYPVQGTDTLGNFLDKVFQSPHVWLAGFGVQSDKPAVISNVVWDATRYTFTQPEVATSCPVVVAGPEATNLDSNGWTFGESRTQGSNTFEPGALRVTTFGAATASPDQRKAAGYHPIDIALADVGPATMDYDATSGAAPGLQLGVDLNNDSIHDGYLVREEVYPTGLWWASNGITNGGFVGLPHFYPSWGGGNPSTPNGQLNEFLLAYPNARVLSYGYSLGSGANGDGTIQSITVACQTATFTTATVPVPTATLTVNDHEIRPNATTVAGWHEALGNPVRAYSVQADGLHFANGSLASKIEYGYPSPTPTTALESLITGTSLDVVSGSVSLQFSLTYGAANLPTTLRSESLSTTGVRGVSVSDVWVTTQPIYAADGTTVIVPGEAKLPVADFAALLTALGNVTPIGVAVQADTSAVVRYLASGGTKYNFTPYVVPPVTSTVRVVDSDIAPNENVYTGWHEGYSNASKSYLVTEDGLVLGTGNPSQIINGFAAALATPAVDLLTVGAGVTVVGGSVTLQVPVFYGTGTDFTTLLSDDLTTGSHTFDLTSSWRSSRSIPTLGIVAFQEYALGDLLDKLTNVRVLAVGAQADVEATVSRIVFNQVEYDFTGSIEPGDPTITGTLAVGQTLTASTGAWAPPGVSYAYEWKSDGTVVGTGSTYVLQATDLGHTIALSITGSLTGYTSVEAFAPGRSPVLAGALTVATPLISGSAAIGQSLTVIPGTWGPAPVTLTYQWLSDGNTIPGATGSSYGVLAADAGHKISVRVSATKPGYTSTSATSPQTTTVPAGTIAPGSPTISGALAVGQTLTAVPGTWGPAPVTLSYQWRRDGAPILGATASTYPVVVADGGAHLSVTVTGAKVGYTTVSATSPQTGAVPFESIAVNRLFGPDRYATAVAISQGFAPGVSRLYLATGVGYADALSATPAAAHYDSPLLLTTPGVIPTTVLAEIERLDPDEIIVVGLQGAVSAAVQVQLEALASNPTLTRIGGADRYATSRLIADDAFTSAATAYIATGANFPDALAAGPAAAHSDGPVVLVPGSQDSVDAAILTLLADLGVVDLKIAGGAAAVTDAIEEQLDGLDYTVKRNAGANRYATAVAINADEFTTAPTVYVATGLNFADALAGAARAGSEGSPLFVSTATCIPTNVFAAVLDLNPSKVTLLGGFAALSVEVEELRVCT